MGFLDRLGSHAADPDAHTYNPFEKIRLGHYFFTPLGNAVRSHTMIADLLLATPYPIAIDRTVDRIGIDVATGSGTYLVVGIYTDDGNCYPGTLIASSGGQLPADGTAFVVVTIDLALTKGLYWVALNCDATPTVTQTQDLIQITGNTAVPVTTRGSVQKAGVSYSANLPATFPSGAVQGYYHPVLLRFSA